MFSMISWGKGIGFPDLCPSARLMEFLLRHVTSIGVAVIEEEATR